MYYFPLTPRLQRLYASQSTLEHRRWHSKSVIELDMMIHNRIEDTFSKFNRRGAIQTRISEGFSSCKKKRAHPETSTGPATTSIPPISMFTSPATMSTPLASASIPPVASIPSAMLTLLPQLPYSSPVPITIPFSTSYAAGTSSRTAPSSSTLPPVPPM
ncbi:hypothetical protein M9H77_09210 [Catharanthus roseus]|uniref:Uncharacterized protein n=1 Tax=Catharanthus roseus TaxID=4058 RepID=A0ACC0C007_CATRO|nr:hypothetical protein M9H77_09210 [Catharanthus roseus]